MNWNPCELLVQIANGLASVESRLVVLQKFNHRMTI